MSRMRALAPRMVGRQAQLQELEEHLRQVRAGSCRVVVVAGEAGVGKTCLLRAFLRSAQGQPEVEILQGSCYEEQPPAPYGPFLDALRAFLRAHGPMPVVEAAGPLAGDLLPLLPELALPGPLAGPGADPQARKQRLFEAFYRALRPQAVRGARILVLEDLHWADQTSLELLRYLARAGEREPFLVLGTYRADEVDGRHPLYHALAQLTRDRLLHEVHVPPLDRPALTGMLGATLDRAVPEAFLAAMVDRTGGNPFFVEEILSTLLDEGSLDAAMQDARGGGGNIRPMIPRSVKDSIHGRSAGLDEATTEVLRYAAVVGRRFDLQLLLGVTGLEETALIRAVSRLVERQLVVEERAGREDRYSFRHALSREAVYEELLGRDRRRRHRAVLDALEGLHPVRGEAALDQLAYHSLQAGELAKAAHYAERAGDRSAQLYAFREAMGQYHTALELQEAAEPRQRAGLLMKLAEAAFPLFDIDVFERCWQEAVRLYEGVGDRSKIGDLYERLSQAADNRGDGDAALAYLRAAIGVLESEPPGRELAAVYETLANHHTNFSRPREGIEWGEKALALAEELGEDEVRVDAMITIAGALAALGELPRAVDLLEHGLDLARRASLLQVALRAYMHLGATLASQGYFTRTVAVLREGLALAEAHGWGVRMSGDSSALGRAELELGHWDRAEEALAATLSAAEMGVLYARFAAVPLKGELLLRRGRPEEARRLLEGLLPADRLQGWLTQLCPILARVRLALGDSQGAQAVLERWIDAWRTAGSPAGCEQELAWSIEVYIGIDQQGRAVKILHELSTVAERSAAPLARAALLEARGLVAAHEGQHVEATAHLRQAVALWQEMEAPYLEAHARRLRAECLLQSGDAACRAEARVELDSAQTICTALGATLELEVIAALTTEQGLAPIPAHANAGRAGVLTRREREVVALIARGCSNRAIAQALVITEKTAENHVGNILGKLGLTSRGQAAAYAVEHGLAGSTPP